MQQSKVAILGLLASIGLALAVATVGHAQWSDNLQGNDRVTIAADQVHEGSLYAAGDQIRIEGTVEGDLYCAGRELILNGNVTGDVLCAVQTATIEGTVGQDVRLAGQYATINSAISGSLTFFGQDLKLLGDGSVAGDVNGAGQYVTLGGNVDQDVLIGGQKLTLQSTVGGDVNVGAEQIELMGDAKIAGDFNYTADRDLRLDESRVDGSVRFNPMEERGNAGQAAWTMLTLMSLALSALAIILLAPRFVGRSSEIAIENPLMVGLGGFALLIGLPILAVFLMISGVLFPLGLLAIAIWLAALVVSQSLFAYLLGSLFWRQQESVILRALAGIVVLVALYLIPGANVLTAFLSLFFGMGMAIATLIHGYRRPHYRVEPVKTRTKKE